MTGARTDADDAAASQGDVATEPAGKPLDRASSPPVSQGERSVEEAAESPTGEPVVGRLADPLPPRCPPEMALVADRVCVDRWEASLVAWRPSEPERPWPPHEPPCAQGVRLRAVAREGVVPQGYISGKQALEACQRSGKRLCTAREWEIACGGTLGWRYPYGPERERGACNDGGRAVHPVVEAARRTGLPPERMWYEGMNSPLINQLPGTVRAAGASRRCTGEYGIYDMVGNLHEWIDDPAGTFRGGYFMDTRINGEGCRYETTAHPFGYHDYSTGFRCCLDPDPVE